MFVSRCFALVVSLRYNCTSPLKIFTSSPGLNAGKPMYGQVEQRKASPREQLLQEPVFPLTVKSSSLRSSVFSLKASESLESALLRRSRSSSSRRSERPHVQSLQGLRRFWPSTLQAGAAKVLVKVRLHTSRRGKLTLLGRPTTLFGSEQSVLVDKFLAIAILAKIENSGRPLDWCWGGYHRYWLRRGFFL